MSNEKPMQEQEPVDNSEEAVDNNLQTTEEAESPDDSYYQKQIEDLQSQVDVKSKEKDDLKIALQQERAKRREAKETSPEAIPEPKMDEAKVLEFVSQAADQKFTEMRVDMATDAFEEELSSISTNEKERELIKLRYKTSIKLSGHDRASIRRDLLLSKAAANLDRVKFSTEAGDITLATSMSGGGGKMSNATSDPHVDLSPEERKLLKNFNVDPKKAARKLAEQS